MSTFLSMTLTANGRALRVLFVDAAAHRTVLAKLLYDGFLSVRKFPSDCRCALAQKQPGPKNTFPSRFCASRLPTWMQSSARIFRSTPYLAYLCIMTAVITFMGESYFGSSFVFALINLSFSRLIAFAKSGEVCATIPPL